MPLLLLPGASVCRAIVDVSTNCMSIVAPCVPFRQPSVYFRHLWRESPPTKNFLPKKIGNITQRCSPYSNVPLPSLSTMHHVKFEWSRVRAELANRHKIYRLLWPPCVADADILAYRCGYCLSSSFFSSPILSGRRLDVYHTSTCDVVLVRI